MELCDLSAVEVRDLLLEKKVSAVEVLEACQARIDAVDGRPGTLDPGPETEEDARRVHAFITRTPELARAQAEAVDKKIAAGEDPGPLAGIPFTVKDIFCVKDTPLHGGFAHFSQLQSTLHGHCGGTPAGGRRVDAGQGQTWMNSLMVPPANPLLSSPHRATPGTPRAYRVVPRAAAPLRWRPAKLSSRWAPIRPALSASRRAFCGVVGLKPTYGRVSRYGLIAFGSSLDCPGPLARSAKDAALMLGAMAGADSRDATAATLEVPDYLAALEKRDQGQAHRPFALIISRSPSRRRMANIPSSPCQKKCARLCCTRVDIYRALGAEIIEDVPMPNTRYGIPVYFVISRVEAASNLPTATMASSTATVPASRWAS